METLEQEYARFDEIDTQCALWSVQSALKDVRKQDSGIRRMSIERRLRHAKTLLEEHAERNGFAV